jgi:pyruvate dehydrogenase E2 component (dihydrolipoamide acetyltransferase)
MGRAAERAAEAASAPVLAKPPVRKLAKDLGIDLASVRGTGDAGTITRDDVERVAQHAAPAPFVSPGGREQRRPVKGVRKLTAEAMVASAFTAPHVTEFVTVDVTRTMKLVARLRRELGEVRVSPLLIVARALLVAVRRHPEINASWDGDAIVVKNYVNLGIAAATPRGLMVPNIKDADALSLAELAEALTSLVSVAREGKATPADLADGTITITNVGVFGVDAGTPILNPGEAAILAFGAVRERPWVHKGKVRPRRVTQLSLSFDHRMVDGELGSTVLADVAAMLERPERLLAWG